MGKKSRRKHAIKKKSEDLSSSSGQPMTTQEEFVRNFVQDFANANFGPSTPMGQAAEAARANHCDVSTIFHEAMKKDRAPLAMDDDLCDEISKLPLTDNVYMVDVHSTTQDHENMPSGYVTEHLCVCGLVTKEHQSNGKHWNNTGIGTVESKANGLSLTLASSAAENDSEAVDYNFNRTMILGTIAKACKNPGAMTGTEPPKRFPIKPSRPRKIVLISEGMVMSILENIRCMGIPELGVADSKLAGSMRSSFSTATDLDLDPAFELNMQRAIESGNASEMMRAYGQRLRDNNNSYYVSEQRQPLGPWKPDPVLDRNTPEEWFARPPSGSFRARMLWGWRTNMELASERNDSSKIRDLCQRYPLDDVKEFVESRRLLTKAAGLGSTKACRALLKYANAAVDGVRSATNQQKWIPIQEDAGDNGKFKGITPLFNAILEGQNSVVRLLVHHLADVQLSPYGSTCTPLHFAVSRGHPSIVESLLFAGADTNATDDMGCTPLEINQVSLDWGNHGTKQFEKIAKMFDTVDTKIKRCAACNAEAPKMHCPCKLHSYCGSQCQRKIWKSHKREHREAMEVWKV